ncbi:hypothetical protein [Micromonospora polyrhachis]|uniref:tRNA G46 methylase TrmB n=1 Tax=Micromonospora polyrhachis TaxID=1282883 RepID=A0A7W7SMF9_9ACTN|nr:hypothetical protein [Micromonospora polyrhachis]MBB4956295.1 tRNA G46 methylase TrmB [Micromonospora polyrhachis]
MELVTRRPHLLGTAANPTGDRVARQARSLILELGCSVGAAWVQRGKVLPELTSEEGKAG